MAETTHFELVSPTSLLASVAVEMAVVPGLDGDFGAMARHAPFLSIVRPGTVTLYNNGKPTRRFFVASGFVQVTEERCTVMSEDALPLESVTDEMINARTKAAEKLLSDAKTPDAEKVATHAMTVAKAMREAFDNAHKGHA